MRSGGFILRILGGSFIGDICDISIVIVGRILDVLGSAVRKLDRVGAHYGAVNVARFGGVKVCVRVVVGYAVSVGVGLGCILQGVGRSWGVVGPDVGGVVGSSVRGGKGDA